MAPSASGTHFMSPRIAWLIILLIAAPVLERRGMPERASIRRAEVVEIVKLSPRNTGAIAALAGDIHAMPGPRFIVLSLILVILATLRSIERDRMK